MYFKEILTSFSFRSGVFPDYKSFLWSALLSGLWFAAISVVEFVMVQVFLAVVVTYVSRRLNEIRTMEDAREQQKRDLAM